MRLTSNNKIIRETVVFGQADGRWGMAAVPDWMEDEEREASRARAAAEGPRCEDEDRYPDPEGTCSRPGDLDDETLAAMDAQAEADAAIEAAGVARGIAAGFGYGYAHLAGMGPLPGSHSGPAAGFGQGMVLDEAPASILLAATAEDAAGTGRRFGGVSDDELMGLIGAQGRLEARHAWELLMAVAEFIRRRPAPGCRAEGPARMPACWSEHAASELALQLHLPPGATDTILDLAWDLTVKLPQTSAALRDGTITLWKAQVIAGGCSPLTAEEARKAEGMVFPGAATVTPRALGDRIKAAAIIVNPDAAKNRREDAAKTRRIEIRGEDSGNASIHGRELPSAAVLAADQNMNARARQLKAQGICGSMDELRAIAFMEAFGVQIDPLASRDDTDAGSQDDSEATSARDAHRQDGSAGDQDAHGDSPEDETGDSPQDGTDGENGGDTDGGNGGRGPAGPRPGGTGGTGAISPLPAGFAGHVNLTIGLPTLLGLAERPGTATRIGTIDPGLARDMAAAAARNPASTWCITVTGPDGRPVAHGCARPAKTAKGAKGAKSPPGPGTRDRPAFPPDGDHSPPGDHGPPGDDHPPPGRHGRWRLNPAALTGNPGGPDMIIDLEALDGPCDHKHQAAGHDPGVKLRHLTGVLNQTCTFPPCRRPAAQSDYEHSRPHDQGGITCLCEAGPVCRHNHRNKQQPGWKLRAASNRGWFKWTTPSGRTYLNGPTQYPA